jgi:glycosyltransferase involved in cell wall biosynthesis
MPNILLETMAAGIPVASSNRGPMPEILGDAGAYFNPENPHDISATLERLIDNSGLRAALADKSHAAARQYSWETCADQTFTFLADVYRQWTEKQ